MSGRSYLLSTVTGLALIASGVVMAQNKQVKLEYKCHFALAGGQQLIHYLVSTAKKPTVVAAQMQGRIIFAKDGKTRLRVSKVVECVKPKQPFKSLESQQLDKITLS